MWLGGFIMGMNNTVYDVSIPEESSVAQYYTNISLADAYMVQLPQGTNSNPELLAKFMFAQQAPWVTGLMSLRDTIVSKLNLKITPVHEFRSGSKKGIKPPFYFKVHASNDREVIMGEDDAHLDFRISVLYRQPDEAEDKEAQLIVSTVVDCHNRLGRNYLRLITPFHRVIVKSGLRRAAAKGFPKKFDD